MRGGYMAEQVTLLDEILNAARECGAFTHLNGDLSFTPRELAAFALRLRLKVLRDAGVAHLSVVETVDAAVNAAGNADDVPLIRQRV